MNSNHPLHLTIGQQIKEKLSTYNPILDPACGGKHHIPLFIGNKKSRAMRTCLVDGLILLNGKVKVILEIEESSFIPTKVCGKFFQAVLSSHFIHESKENKPLCFSDKTLFIQVIDSSKFPLKTSKVEQINEISSQIKNLLSDLNTARKLNMYEVVLVKGDKDLDQINVVTNLIQDFLCNQGDLH